MLEQKKMSGSNHNLISEDIVDLGSVSGQTMGCPSPGLVEDGGTYRCGAWGEIRSSPVPIGMTSKGAVSRD